MKKISLTLLFTAALLPLQGCEWADDLGRHMPVIGERCENWQCFTSGGQAQSEANKRALATRGASEQKRTPINPQYQPQQQAGQQPVPQAPAQPEQEKARTPFDMSPEELNDMPATPSY